MHWPPGAWAQKAPKPGRWLQLESPNFIVYSTATERKSREEVAALEAFHSIVARLMPRSRPNVMKLPVYMTETERDFLATSPSLKGSSIVGFYAPRIEEVYAVSGSVKNAPRQRNMPKNVRADDARTTLFHEYAHHYVFANERTAYPAWYHEGFAEFLSTVEFRGSGADIGKFTLGQAYWLQRRDWLDVEIMLTRQPYELKGEQTFQFYSQAWLLTHMLFVRRERAKGFDAYIKALQNGGDPLESFEPAFGISVKAFEKELQDYKSSSIQFWRMEGVAPDASNITVQRLGPSADELLLPAVFLRSLPDKEEAAETVSRVRAEAKKHPGDAYAMRVGALAEVWHGDLNEARRQIDQLLAIETSAEAEHLSGLCDLRAAHEANSDELFERAQSAFGRAHNLDESRVSSMFRYVEAGFSLSHEIDSHLMDVLVAACNLAPQVSEIAVTTASALMMNGRFKEAQFILRPIASNPHGGALAQLARNMQEEAEEEDMTRFYFVGGVRFAGG